MTPNTASVTVEDSLTMVEAGPGDREGHKGMQHMDHHQSWLKFISHFLL